MRVQRTSVARVAAQQTILKIVAGKITEAWVAVFWATFIMKRAAQSVYSRAVKKTKRIFVEFKIKIHIRMQNAAFEF